MSNLIDPMNRPITYLRVSLTQQCNLRCSYCYGSASGPVTRESQMSTSDILRIIKAFSILRIAKIRFTGGEPLLRAEIIDLVKQTSALDGISLVGLTTNGLMLKPLLPELIQAGLNCLNISLDTLDRALFRKITGVDGFEQVLAAVTSAEKSGAFEFVKVNTVVMRGINDSDIRRFALWALSRKIDLRFIEFMPACGSGWGHELFMDENEIKARIGLNLLPLQAITDHSGPAISYGLPGAAGRISFISAVSRSFCIACNRVRLTSQGELLGCLFSDNRHDLRQLLCEGARAEEIARHISAIVSSPGFRKLATETSVVEFNPLMRSVGG